ncbi:helix-turn-helix transcriptional regulator [Clavibacter michiganensis]|uniref:helix-turn-helix transcriptional regulator n=1 Tax=Clavibacter michiganensis TaxID=28447 RepID=UPI002931D5FF|nr:LuxR C-terminal-related transcriptional regulator [Clavibacter michiganensis]
MFIYREELRALLDAIRSGMSAHLVAQPGMGTTTILCRLVANLESEGFVVLNVKGHACSAHGAYLALHEAGFEAYGARGPRSLGALIDAVAEELLHDVRRAVVIDRVEALDAGSLEVLQAAAERTHTPMVISRSSEFLALRRAGVNLTYRQGVRVHLRPLDFVGTARLVQERLRHQPSSDIVSRVFARSVGVPGLAMAVIDGAVATNRISLVADRWVMSAPDLWSPAVEGWLESRMAALSVEQIEALQHVALAHLGPNQDPCSHVPAELLRELEGLGLLWVSAQDGRILYSIDPPALVSYFHIHASGIVRSALAAEAAAAVVGDGIAHSDRVARAVRTFRRETERRAEQCRQRWETNRIVATALPYLMSMLATASNDREARRVFAHTPSASARSAEEAFDFAFLRSTWRSHFGPARPLPDDEFDDFLAHYPDWGDALALMAALIDGDPSAVASRFDPGAPRYAGELPGADVALSAFAFAELVVGNFPEATRALAAVPASPLLIVRRHTGFIRGLAQFGVDALPEALASSREGLDAALSNVDHDAILLNTYVGMLALVGLGRWDEALKLIDQAIAFGPPAPVDAPLYRALLFCGSYINAVSGERRLAELLLAEADSFSVDDQPLPWMQHDASEIIHTIIHGDRPGGIALLRDLGRDLVERGALFAAAATLKTALATWPDAEMVDLLVEVSERSGRGLPDELVVFLRDGLKPDVSTSALTEIHLPEPWLPLASMVLQARLHQEEAVAGPAEAALSSAVCAPRDRLSRNAAHLGPTHWGGTVQAAPVERLSPREVEVALLARAHSNGAIASRLNLSVRTVESHIHNAFKKLGVATRRELAEALDG